MVILRMMRWWAWINIKDMSYELIITNVQQQRINARHGAVRYDIPRKEKGYRFSSYIYMIVLLTQKFY